MAPRNWATGVSMSSENVRISAQGKCPAAFCRVADLVDRLGVRLTGGARESTYFLTVFLEIPSSLALPRRETPCSLAWCTAFHRACLRGVASLGGGVSAFRSSSLASC